MDRHITAPINKETARSLHAGDYVYITGTMYTARDAAHKRMYEILQKGGELPVDWKDQVIYYMGPSPARGADRSDQQVETTASRMDKYAPQLLDLGLGAMVGKRQKKPGCYRCDREKWFSIFCGGRRSRSSSFQMYYFRRGGRL